MKERKTNPTIISERSLTNEGLILIGFGCNVGRSDWILDSSRNEYFEALKRHGAHNLKYHIDNSKASITFRYKQK